MENTFLDYVNITISHYNCLDFLELSLNLIRNQYKKINILVSDDISNYLRYRKKEDRNNLCENLETKENIRKNIIELCNDFKVNYVFNQRHLGHQKGALQSIKNALDFSKNNNKKISIILSQRCIVDYKGWVEECINDIEMNNDVLCHSINNKGMASYFLVFNLESIYNKNLYDKIQFSKNKNLEGSIYKFIMDNNLNCKAVGFKNNILHRLKSSNYDYCNVVKKYGFFLKYFKDYFYINSY
jgi:hypothetical protein